MARCGAVSAGIVLLLKRRFCEARDDCGGERLRVLRRKPFGRLMNERERRERVRGDKAAGKNERPLNDEWLPVRIDGDSAGPLSPPPSLLDDVGVVVGVAVVEAISDDEFDRRGRRSARR